MKRLIRYRRGLLALIAVPLVWTLGDWGYARITAQRLAAWEAGVRRDASGVREGCGAFSTGAGDTALLMVHGFADSPALFRPMAAQFAASGVHCRAMRLPGFAEAMPSYAQTTAAAWSGALGEELRTLRATHDRVYIVAHSLGAAVSIRYLMDHPRAADGAIYLAPLLGVSNRRSPILSAETWYRITDPVLVHASVIESIFEQDLAEGADEDFPRDRFVPRAVYHGMFQALDDVRARPTAQRGPTLVFVAEADKVADPAAAAAFFASTQNPAVDLRRLARSGHVIPMDVDRDAVFEAIRAFVAALQAEPDSN